MPVSAVTRGGCVSVNSGSSSDYAEAGLFIAAGHFHVRFGVADQRERLCFTARTGCGRDGNHGQHCLGRFADAPIILNLPAVGIEKIDSLGTIHRTAAAKTDDQFRLKAFGNFERFSGPDPPRAAPH